MPIYEYLCRQCGHKFEAIVQGDKSPVCPSCQNERLEKQFSAFAVGSTGDWSAASSSAPCGSCGDPRGPGACSLN